MAAPARAWNTTAAEQALAFPCDRHLVDFDDALFRAVDVDAPPPVLFRWLCQLRVAPYSYDWIDNWGRRSPRTLVPGLDALTLGQPFMGVFELVDFEPGRSLTARTPPSWLGAFAVTYAAVAVDGTRCRLVAKLVMVYPPPIRPILRVLAPLADVIMMRKQLLTLKELAEGSTSR
jgi:hypothetical protein